MEKKTSATPYEFEGKIPLRQVIPLGLQHVLAMFVGNLTPILVVTGTCAAVGGEDFAALQVTLLQNAMLVAGVLTLVQLFTVGPMGGRVPIVMGTSSSFIGVFQGIANMTGGGVVAYGAIMGASMIGGLVESILGAFLKPLRRFFPSIVTGTVVMTIGLSLIGVGVATFGGGSDAPDYSSLENLMIGFAVMTVILALKHGTKGIWSSSSILIGILFGYALCAVLPTFLPTTGVTAEGVEYTKAWVLNWDKVAQASWFAVPAFMPVKPVFQLGAILPVIIMFMVSAVETLGDIAGVMEGGMGREATDRELSGGIICDGLGSSFAALFGVMPNTSFSQNVGLVSVTKVVNRFALACGAGFLVLCGLMPKLAALISIMPQSVLGGAAVIMFSSIVMGGIQLITKEPLTSRNMTIVMVALGLGYGFGANASILSHMPELVQLVFGGSGIVPAALVAIVLNIVLPKEKEPAKAAE